MSENIQSIAQNNYILTTQQEVSHDSTLSGNGTVDSPLGVVPGYNETVLWSGYSTTTGAIQLSESVRNFETVECYGDAGNGWADHARPQIYGKAELGYYNSGAAIFTLTGMSRVSNGTVQIRCMPIDLNQTTATPNQAFQLNISTGAAITRENTTCALTRIVGINRISANS